MTAPSPELPMYDLLDALDKYGVDAYYRLVADGVHPNVFVSKVLTAAGKGYVEYGTGPTHPWLTVDGVNTIRRWRTEGRPR